MRSNASHPRNRRALSDSFTNSMLAASSSKRFAQRIDYSCSRRPACHAEARRRRAGDAVTLRNRYSSALPLPRLENADPEDRLGVARVRIIPPQSDAVPEQRTVRRAGRPSGSNQSVLVRVNRGSRNLTIRGCVWSYFGCFDFARKAWRPASALRISGSPCIQALSIVTRLKRHFWPSRTSSQS